MSTQGCVAFGTLQSWRGVYNNNSSYPTGLGPLVWEQIKKYGPKGLVEELRRLTDWRDIYTDGVCPYCGKRQGFPKDISALIAYDWSYNWALDCTSLDDVRHLTLNRKLSPAKDLGNIPLVKIENLSRLLDDVNREAEHVWTVIQNIRQTRYPDPDAKFHAHFEAGENHITHATVNPFYIEYVYIIDVEANRLHILYQHVITPNNPGWEEAEKEALSSPDVNEFDYPGGFVNVEGFFEFNGKHAYYQKHPSIISWHEVLASIDLDGDEPDWDQLEEMAHLLAKKPEVVRAN